MIIMTMHFNFLGISFVADDIPKKKVAMVERKMEEIIEKHKHAAQEELDVYLEQHALESAMGVIIPKAV